MIVKANPEFGIELALVVPYAYHLHTQGKLDSVITSKGMKPFYYFCDDVREEFDFRTIDNAAAGLNELPNNWIHGVNPLEKPAVLNYDEWTPPPYKEHYWLNTGRKSVFISNKYNLEHGEEPFGFFDIQCLYDMFSYLLGCGYEVIYKRATNKESEFAIDQNEMSSIHQGYDNITANVEGIGVISDRDLPKYMEGMISYVHKGKELRPNYFGEESYFRKLSGANVVPVYDVIGKVNTMTYDHKINETGKQDYTGLMETIKNEIK